MDIRQRVAQEHFENYILPALMEAGFSRLDDNQNGTYRIGMNDNWWIDISPSTPSRAFIYLMCFSKGRRYAGRDVYTLFREFVLVLDKLDQTIVLNDWTKRDDVPPDEFMKYGSMRHLVSSTWF